MITYKKDSKDNLQLSDSSMPVLAMCYDFDKTLTPDDMQAQGFIQSVGYNEEQIKQFWHESNQLAKKHDMDNNFVETKSSNTYLKEQKDITLNKYSYEIR